MQKTDISILGTNSLQSSKFISLIYYRDLFFSLIEKDNTTNKEVNTFQYLIKKKYSSYLEKFTGFNPLGDFTDDIDDLFDFAQPYIAKVIHNPRNKMLKESAYIQKHKIKNLEPKVFSWLANKPGSTLREKLINVRKVKSFVKFFSPNTKENQVAFDFIKIIHKYEKAKLGIIISKPDIFGIKGNRFRSDKVISLYNAFNDLFDNISSKRIITPNNVLLNDRTYSPIWQSYKKLLSINFYDSFEITRKTIQDVILEILKSEIQVKYNYQVLDYPRKVYNNTIDNIFIENNQDLLNLVTITQDDLITISVNKIQYKKIIQSTKNLKIDISVDLLSEEQSDFNRGLLFKLTIRNKEKKFHFDQIGIAECLEYITKEIPSIFKKIELIPPKDSFVSKKPFVLLSTYDNFLFDESGFRFIFLGSFDDVVLETPIELQILDESYSNIIGISNEKKNQKGFLNYFRNLIDHDDYLIYDSSDIVDEFNAQKTRNNFSTYRIKAYPVWRSILAAETLSDSKIKYVFDLCGDESYLAEIDYKKNLFVHIGPIDYSLGNPLISEKDLLKNYLKRYFMKYRVKIEAEDDAIEEIIKSGKVSNLLFLKDAKRYYFAKSRSELDQLFSVTFDQEIFNSINQEIVNQVNEIEQFYDFNQTIVLLPSFFDTKHLKAPNMILNHHLQKGAETIRLRINQNQVTWYERLPNLSLEIIKNGIWDVIDLTKNREEENIIGKKVDINVEEDFVLKKGETEFHLPLRKSFLGEANKDFIAVLKHSSFPLKEDIQVNLKLIYQYGAENAYRLFFIPKQNNEMFKDIEVSWENAKLVNENQATEELINPIINGFFLSENQKTHYMKRLVNFIDKITYVASHTIHSNEMIDYMIEKKMWNYLKCKTKTGKDLSICFINEFQREIFFITNSINRLSNVNYKSLVEDKKITAFIPILVKWIKGIDNNYENRFLLQNLEQLLATLTLDINYLKEEFYRVPEGVFGRYLSVISSNRQLVEFVYSHLAKKINREKSKDNENSIRIFLQALTSASAINHNFLVQMYEISPPCVLTLFNLVLQSVKSLQTCVFLKSNREAAFYMNDIIELLFAFLFLRDKVAMFNFNPNQKISNEIIVYLKEYLRNYTLIKKENEMLESRNEKIKYSRNLPQIKTKLRFTFEKPIEFINVPDPIYSLILYLSGDSFAKKVMIHAVEE
jgi:hypothetical protein